MTQVPDLHSYRAFCDIENGAMLLLRRLFAIRRYEPGAPIISQGENDRCLFILIEGRAWVYLDDVLVGLLKEGEEFGEMYLFDVVNRSANVIAETGVVAAAICHHDLEILRKAFPDDYHRLLYNLATVMAERLVLMNGKYAQCLKKHPDCAG
jgi:CRP-like cAMP-binding protein